MHPSQLVPRLIILCASTATLALGQRRVSTGTQPTQAYADSVLQAGDFQAASDAFRSIVQREPSNDLAWYRLGVSLERLKRGDEAIAAYERAAKSPSQQMGAELGLTRVFVQAGSTDRALEHLRRLATVGIDPALLDQFPALAPLRSHPRFAEIHKLAESNRFPCRDVHTFDFWVGDFDAMPWSQSSGPSRGQLHNTREYDGCVIIERWASQPGASPPGASPPGMSMSFYDVNAKRWRFIWNDDSNGSIEFEGNYRDGAMQFEAWFSNPDGTKSLARNVLRSVSADIIRHTFSVSSDSGKTWTVANEDRFVRRKP